MARALPYRRSRPVTSWLQNRPAHTPLGAISVIYVKNVYASLQVLETGIKWIHIYAAFRTLTCCYVNILSFLGISVLMFW